MSTDEIVWELYSNLQGEESDLKPFMTFVHTRSQSECKELFDAFMVYVAMYAEDKRKGAQRGICRTVALWIDQASHLPLIHWFRDPTGSDIANKMISECFRKYIPLYEIRHTQAQSSMSFEKRSKKSKRRSAKRRSRRRSRN